MSDRLSILRHQKGRCFYCGGAVADGLWETDHFIPRSKGGQDCPQNRVICCRDCNSAKADRMPTPAEVWRYLKFRRSIGGRVYGPVLDILIAAVETDLADRRAS